jgi:hypothetical protein
MSEVQITCRPRKLCNSRIKSQKIQVKRSKKHNAEKRRWIQFFPVYMALCINLYRWRWESYLRHRRYRSATPCFTLKLARSVACWKLLTKPSAPGYCFSQFSCLHLSHISSQLNKFSLQITDQNLYFKQLAVVTVKLEDLKANDRSMVEVAGVKELKDLINLMDEVSRLPSLRRLNSLLIQGA